MDGLMSEAADLFLSSNSQIVKESSNVLRFETRRNSIDVADRSSLALLRRSITTSIRERRTQSDVLDIETSDLNKIRRRKGSISRKPKVKINQLSSDKGNLHIDASSKVVEVDKESSDIKEQNKSLHVEEESKETPNKMCLNLKECDSEIVENESNAIGEIISNSKKENSRKKTAENGLKLARRNFSDSIFENCSTYSLTCPEVLQEKDNSMPSSQNSHTESTHLSTAESTKILTYKPENVYSHSDPLMADKKRNIDSDDFTDGQISLSDSFFVHIVNGDNSSQSSSISKEDDCSTGIKRLSGLSVSKENDLSISEDKISDNSRRYFPKSEKKLNKKLRKRHKKTKSKDASTYECPKCGVSYILSANASESTARCLHCDFWVSVEPVFLKRGKQAWNTCRIC